MAIFERFSQPVNVYALLRIDDQNVVSQGTVQREEFAGRRFASKIGFGQNDERIDLFELRECENLVEREETRRRIGERGHCHDCVNVCRHRLGPAVERAPGQCKRAFVYPFDEGASVFEHARVHAIARCEHRPFTDRPFEVGHPRGVFGVEHNPCSVFTDGNNSRRERLTHAANDCCIVNWARTLRVDASPSDALQARIASKLTREGVSLRFAGSPSLGRTYVLVEGPQSVDPAELQAAMPDARWYPDAIIALAIEPAPADALPRLADALGGAGAPAGICSCEVLDGRILLEFRPQVTQASLLVRIAEVELRRFSGYRRTELLSPLPIDVIAQVTADGLQAAEIDSNRILESLIGIAHVE